MRVVRVVKGPEELGLVELSYEGFALRVSRKHPVLTGNGMKPAGELQPGEIVFDGEGRERRLERVTLLPIEEGQRVINFILDGALDAQDRMILAEGIVSGDLIVQLDLAAGRPQ